MPVHTREVHIREVGPRDGLQSEATTEVGDRIRLIDGLVAAGARDVEAVAFVSPKAVPQMAGAAEVMAGVTRSPGVRFWGLVPNARGAQMAVEAGVDAITVTISACPVYNQKNINRSIDESAEGIGEIVALADGRPVDAVVSCVFGSPYTGDEPMQTTGRLLSRLRESGVDQCTLADTTGMATPARIAAVLNDVGDDVGLHLHDTRGTALVNAWTGYGLGVRRFDTALGGLGGSPFAEGAGGNLPTEDLVHLVGDAAVEHGFDLGALLGLGPLLEEMVGRPLPGRVMRHGPRSASVVSSPNE